MRGKDPADAFFDLLIEEHGQVSCMAFMMDEKDVVTLMQAPWVDICSDGSALAVGGLLGEGHPHPRNTARSRESWASMCARSTC